MLIPLLTAPLQASAQEALFIRIRPLPDAEAARVAREMLWARRQAHARAVIESVCTGCLGAWKAEAPPTTAARPGLAEAREAQIANLAVPIGVELDPSAGASDEHPDPSTSEVHP
ncbi:hypothetical protein MMSR116_16270 [Methylobacterium mesophilicum SR1.6/6]|uniref:Uncharacterized protein n=1 Tax=Methylobacterium mesophilicum SR1.6/6 TaxID=908290 RepID=A0A6B9FUU0_9HYPH|nr:hypothetical protein MMSR116_16270 [Methylobacterium mesophilicum SR1.6/6]